MDGVESRCLVALILLLFISNALASSRRVTHYCSEAAAVRGSV